MKLIQEATSGVNTGQRNDEEYRSRQTYLGRQAATEQDSIIQLLHDPSTLNDEDRRKE